MLLCGFPTDIICKMDFRTAYSDSDLSFQRLAREVLPVPVFMAIFLATLASVPWSYADDGDESDTEATLKHDMEEPDSIFARLKKPDTVSLCKWGENRENRARRTVATNRRHQTAESLAKQRQQRLRHSAHGPGNSRSPSHFFGPWPWPCDESHLPRSAHGPVISVFLLPKAFLGSVSL